MEHAQKKVVGSTFLMHDDTSNFVQPHKQLLDFPAPLVSLPPTSTLGRPLSILKMRSLKQNGNRHDLCSLAVLRLSLHPVGYTGR
jgi:hypothetical protein